MNLRIIRNWAILIVCIAAVVLWISQRPPDAVQAETPYILFYYYQDGCPACDEIEPIIDGLADEFAGCVTLKRRNVLWSRGHSVRGTPTVVLESQDGKEIHRWVGAQGRQRFIQFLNPLCKD